MDLDPYHWSPVVCSILRLLITFPCRNWWYKECNKTDKSPDFAVKRKLDLSNRIIFYKLQYLIDFVNLFICMNNNVTKIYIFHTHRYEYYAWYPWTQPAGYNILSWELYILVVTLFLLIVAKMHLLQRKQNCWPWKDGYQKLLNCTCSNL